MSNDFQYNICPRCDGEGLVDFKACPKCNGRGVEMRIESDIYYWGREMSRIARYQRRLQELLNQLINFVFLLTGAAGIVSLGIYIYLINDLGLIWKSIIIPVNNSRFNVLILFFWVAIFLFIFLIYRLNKYSKKATIAVKRRSYENEISEKKEKNVRKKISHLDISASFNREAIAAVERACEIARKSRDGAINPISLLRGLFFSDAIRIIFLRLGIDYSHLKQLIGEGAEKLKQGNHYFFKRVLLESYEEAYTARREKVEAEDIFISLVKNDYLFPSYSKEGVLKDIFYEFGIDLTKIINVVQWIRIGKILEKNRRRFRRRAFFKPKGNMNRAMTAIATPILDHFSQDLTLLAKYGYLSPCIGRRLEIEAIFRAVDSGRRGIVLCGNPGVGRSAIIEGIAQMMVEEDVPSLWRDKRIIGLSIARLISGASPEQAMERLSQAIDESSRSGNIILAIDNIENMIGVSAGRDSSLDLSEVLVSAMSKLNMIVLATITPNNYSRYMENAALIEVFQKVNVEEPGDNELIQILEAKTSYIESRNEVCFTYAALEKAMMCAKRFIHDKFLPEKAINLIEEAGVYVRKKKGKQSIILDEDIAELVSRKINIPLTKITEKESEKLVNLEERIHKRLVNQVEAVKAVAGALRRARVEFRDIKRPIANLLFLGPTGVGKTELAKTVAEVYFGNENDIIRLDMSEYQNQDSLDRLIGSPDNYGITGILTEQVRKRPFSLVLLDEIEKAHADILNIFLQVLDDGRLTDNQGRIIDFTNAMIIATSNAGTVFIHDEIKKRTSIEEIRSALINRELKRYFKPEFLNRFDGIIVFKPLEIEHVKQIAKLMLKKSAKRMDEKGIKLELADSVIDWIAKIGFDPIFGARPLRRAIQENIDTILAEKLISGEIGRGDRVIVEEGGIVSVKKD